ncbi:MAG TPA: peptidoglycan-binding domain-containing protein [Myxococcales bacterium]|jgi:peptidoglycan hydrolase-like protein with peptidoglycan-binding domain
MLACAACFHTHKVAKGDKGDTDAKEEKSDGERSAPQPKESEGGAAAKPSQARRPEKPGRPPLSAGPAGLFVPGGVEQVQNALAHKGYLDMGQAKEGEIDAQTSAAVRKFQSDQGIARTGNPDHETLRRLGLDPDKLFRKAEDVKK